MGKLVISFTLDSEADRDLKRWLDGLRTGERSEAIRATLRDGLARGGVTLGDVYQAVRDIERRLQAGIVVGQRMTDQGEDVPADVAAALDALGKV